MVLGLHSEITEHGLSVERRDYPSCMTELQDAATGDRSGSYSTVGHEVLVSHAREQTETGDEDERRPMEVDRLGVPEANATVAGRFTGEPSIDTGSHCLLVNKESARLSLYLARQLSVF